MEMINRKLSINLSMLHIIIIKNINEFNKCYPLLNHVLNSITSKHNLNVSIVQNVMMDKINNYHLLKLIY